jgi:hypothetical protein
LSGRPASGSSRWSKTPASPSSSTWSSSSPEAARTGTATAAPQLLLVKEGRGLVQKWGEPGARALPPATPSASSPTKNTGMEPLPDTKMAHFAVNLTLTTEWLEPVSDDQYRAS